MSHATAATITVRKPRFDFAGVGRHYVGDSAVASHVVNGVCMLFPAGERFFIRSVQHYARRLPDGANTADIRAFMAQEAQHGLAHEAFFAVLREQGYPIETFLAWYERVAHDKIETRQPPWLRLSVTVALEHLTASLAHAALADGLLDHVQPQVAAMLKWHAAEEIEHKAVAFDVFQAVDGSYVHRVAGMAFALVSLTTFSALAARPLLRRDRQQRAWQPLRDWRRDAGEVGYLLRRAGVRRAVATYLRPGFHPNDCADRELAAQVVGFPT